MPRRPASRPPLTVDAIVTQAIVLADQGGVHTLTMRSLAAALGVEAMSLYHHIRDKEALLDLMVDTVIGDIRLPVAGQPWREAMSERATSAREVLTRHPWALPLLDSRRSAGPATIRHHDAVIGCLRAAGFPLALTAHVVALLDSFVYGYVLQAVALPFDGPDDLATLAAEVGAAFPATHYPHFAEMVEHHILQPGYSFDAEFDWGLTLLLEGVERRLH